MTTTDRRVPPQLSPAHPQASNGAGAAAAARGLTNRKAATATDRAPPSRSATTSSYTLMYNDKGSGADLDGAFYRPTATNGFYILGDYAQGTTSRPSLPSITIIGHLTTTPPTRCWRRPWAISRCGMTRAPAPSMDGSIWMPIAPSGFVALGAVSQNGYSQPDIPQLCCMRFDLVTTTAIGQLIWNDKGSGADEDVEI